jgi:hypothetical protein
MKAELEKNRKETKDLQYEVGKINRQHQEDPWDEFNGRNLRKAFESMY